MLNGSELLALPSGMSDDISSQDSQQPQQEEEATPDIPAEKKEKRVKERPVSIPLPPGVTLLQAGDDLPSLPLGPPPPGASKVTYRTLLSC